MKSLKQALIEETQELKGRYLAQTKEWAEARFAFLKKVEKWRELDWCKYFGLTPELANAPIGENGKRMEIAYDPNYKLTGSSFWSMPRGYYGSPNARSEYSIKAESRSAMRRKKEGYLEDAHKKSERHYNDSIDKLVLRLNQKGIKDGEVQIKKGWVGINLEMTVTVGSVTVKAWTIIAQGQIQRPHYRYLVK